MKQVFYALCLLLCSAMTLFSQEKTFLESSEIFLEALRSSHYQHKIAIDEENHSYGLDCSAFVGLLLQRSAPTAYASLPIDPPHKRPRAKNFYAFLTDLSEGEEKGGWGALKKMEQLQKGDVIAWKYALNLGKKDTGHVVIVYEKPLKEEEELYKVLVLDSSKGMHANDTRMGKPEGGIGMGTMWFKVDENDKPIGLFWSDKRKKMSEHAIAMGRVLF